MYISFSIRSSYIEFFCSTECTIILTVHRKEYIYLCFRVSSYNIFKVSFLEEVS